MSNTSEKESSDESTGLPARRNFGNLEEVRRLALLHGHDVDVNARALSATEWESDLWRAEALCESLRLSETRMAEVAQLLVARNREIWGDYCEAKLPYWLKSTQR